MMKVTGIPSVKEAVNFLLGKVGEPYINNYVDHLASEAGRRNSPFSIVPGMLATGYPAGKQTVNDSGASQSGEIFCEIKTQQPNTTRYNTTITTTQLLDLLIGEQNKLLGNMNSSSENLIECMLLML